MLFERSEFISFSFFNEIFRQFYVSGDFFAYFFDQQKSMNRGFRG
jgi:hypothetical protein